MSVARCFSVIYFLFIDSGVKHKIISFNKMYCSIAVTPCTMRLDDAPNRPFEFTRFYLGSLVDECLRKFREMGTVRIEEAARFYFWFATVKHREIYSIWAAKSASTEEQVAAC